MTHRNYFFITITLFFSTFSVQAAPTLEDQESLKSITRENIKFILEKHTSENPDLLNSSKEKDIVVFLGKTGSGKSTLINYLADKDLKGNENGDILLKDPLDPTAMKIGIGSDSETFLPKFIRVGNLWHYDLPGFDETRGTAISLVNACFIKNIIENARSTRIVFVSGQDEVTAVRGEAFKNLLAIIRNLIPDKTIENISLLVITKSTPGRSREQFFNNLLSKVEPNILNPWIEGKRVGRMFAPINEEIKSEEKSEIIELINNTTPQKINTININSIFNLSERNKLSELYSAEIEEISTSFFNNNFNPNIIFSLDVNGLNTKKQYFQNSFLEEVSLHVNNSLFINLLRPISEDLYISSWDTKRNTITLKRNQIIGQIDGELKNREKKVAEEQARIQAENARRAQEQARIQAENARRAQEQANIQAENARRADQARSIAQENERINNPANWPVKAEQTNEVSLYWGQKFLGGWEEFRSGSGWSRRTKHRKQYYEKEISLTITKQRQVASKADGTQSVIRQDWHEISRSEQPTGNIRGTGNYEY